MAPSRSATIFGLTTGLLTFGAACGGGAAQQSATHAAKAAQQDAAKAKAAPAFPAKAPEPGAMRDFALPEGTTKTLSNGLRVQVLPLEGLPLVYLNLVVFSGAETDGKRQGLAQLTAALMDEGTKGYSSAALAEQVEALGASLSLSTDSENLFARASGLSQHFPKLAELLAEVIVRPTFPSAELRKLQLRQKNRLARKVTQPKYQLYKTLLKQLYGRHPYGRVDVDPKVVDTLKRSEVARWHRSYVRPNNATLIVVGQVEAASVFDSLEKAFAAWKSRPVPTLKTVTPKPATQRRVTIVDRPASVQSVIAIANLGLPRKHEDFVALNLANQVLGGSAASRLFMDLREKRSLTYGAYSSLTERVEQGAFVASAAVRTEVTAEAVEAFFEHLERIRKEAAPEAELTDAKRYLTDSFPLQVETAGRIAGLVAEGQIFDLGPAHWNAFRKATLETDAAQALEAAKAHIRPDAATVVIVGDASKVAEGLRRWGDVTVVDSDGKAVRKLPAL